MTTLLAIVALGVGVLLGATSIGGILLIPAVQSLAGRETHAAMATVLLSQFFTALLGVFLHQRRGNIDWRSAGPVCLGAAVSGYLGALVNARVHADVLGLLLSLLIVFAGINALRRNGGGVSEFDGASVRHRVLLILLGMAVGFVSGLTGVGGPVLSVPLMLAMGFPTLTAIALGQPIQIAAAATGSAGNLVHGVIDFGLAWWITALQLAGVALGVRLADRTRLDHLRLAVAVLCLAVGGFILLRALARLFG